MNRPNLQIIAHLTREELRALSEDDFNWAIRDAAKRRGWMVGGALKVGRPGRDGKWRAYADGGLPDLTLARRDDLLVAELKSETGTPTPEQRAWIAAYLAAGIEAHIWKPRDSAAIVRRLE